MESLSDKRIRGLRVIENEYGEECYVRGRILLSYISKVWTYVSESIEHA
jgi:hypothetical protein